jgi:hypothetical protein
MILSYSSFGITTFGGLSFAGIGQDLLYDVKLVKLVIRLLHPGISAVPVVPPPIKAVAQLNDIEFQ